MNLFLTAWNDVPGTIAFVDGEGRLWGYVANTGAFHLNSGMFADFYFDHEDTYTPISAEQARTHIAAGIGHIDERRLKNLVEEYRADPAALPVSDVVQSSPPVRPTATQSARARARALAEAPLGQSIQWATYPPEGRQKAYVAASDLRSGKIKSVASLLPLATNVGLINGQYVVTVWRTTDSPNTSHE